MKKLLIITLAGLMCASVSTFAEVDSKALRKINDIQKGKNNRNQIQTLRVQKSGNILSNLTVGAALIVNNITVSNSITASNGLTVSSGDITLENSETIDNATDADVRVTFNDLNSNILGQVIFESDTVATNMTDNDMIEILFNAFDDQSNKITYAKADFGADDVTSNTVDGSFVVSTLNAGNMDKVFTAASGDLTVHDELTVTTNLTVAGQYTMLGPDASTRYRIEAFSNLVLSGGTYSQAFGTAFSAAPITMGLSWNTKPSIVTGTNIFVFVSSRAADHIIISGNVDLAVSGSWMGAD